MSATKRTRASSRSAPAAGSAPVPPRSASPLPPTLGPVVCRWIEANLVHAEGDYFGQPFKLRPWQRAFLYRAYELGADGSRAYDQALWGIPKGNGKTEIAGAICCAELAGPVVFDGWNRDGTPRGKRRLSPDIPVAAASFEQADKVFGAAASMIKHGRLTEFFDVFETEILLKNGDPGRMYRVAAVAGTNDGGLPTLFCADELHEWTGKKRRVHLVLSNGRAKRKDAWELNISTAGWDTASLLGEMVARGRRIVAGEEPPNRFLFVWHEFVEGVDAEGKKVELDFSDPVALAAAIRQANPAADDFLSVDARIARAREIPEHEFRRYYLNQWVDAPERWLPAGAWERCADPVRQPPVPKAEVVLFLDGRYDGKSCGIVGATVEEVPHLFLVGAWEKGRDEKWKVSIADVAAALRKGCERWTVMAIGLDPNRWPQTAQMLEDEGLPLVEWQSHLASRMVPACAQFYDAVTSADGARVSQDGDARVAAHIAAAIVKIDGRGPRIAKDHEDSDRHIDLAIAAVGAYDLAVRAGGDRPADSVYNSRGLLSV